MVITSEGSGVVVVSYMDDFENTDALVLTESVQSMIYPNFLTSSLVVVVLVIMETVLSMSYLKFQNSCFRMMVVVLVIIYMAIS
jgi:hypothetical protein